MVLALLAAAAAQSVPEMPRHVAAQSQARASVRILRPAVIQAERLDATEESVKRETSVRDPDGTVRSASLIEFY